MKRAIKNGSTLLLVSFFVLTIGYWAARDNAYAGGGINYKVTMQNPTKHKCKVAVWVEKVTHRESLAEKTIPAESTASWETGALCPVGVTGDIYSELDQKWFTMQRTTCEGINIDFVVAIPHCFDVNLEVVRKNGIGYPNVRDEDYGFRKR